ncbi:MAG TPA: hypothetical protein P5216_04990 [Bacteroidota bacterium]|nr:hypothetical protein [Bacteroidota bacterium]
MKRYALLILFISLAFFPFSILKCEVQDSIGIDSTKSIDSTEIVDSTKSISQSLHEKFDTAYVGTNVENIKGFIRYFRLGVGYGYHFQNYGDFKKTNGTLWNFSFEIILDKKRNWSFELALYPYMLDNYSFDISNIGRGPHYMGTIVFKRYFPYFGKYIKPAIFAGAAPIIEFCGETVGIDLDFEMSKIFQVKASFSKIWQHEFNIFEDNQISEYSPYIVNLKICFTPDF